MDAAEIQRLLDSFDMQLAEGRIDLATYQELSGRWRARLGEAPAAAAPPPPPPVIPIEQDVEAVKVSCPNCGGSLEDSTPGSDGMHECLFCGHSYRVQSAKAKLQEELQQWLGQYVSEQARSTVVDSASRSVIFQDKLLPSLERDFDRLFENVDGYREHPLIELPLASRFGPAFSGGLLSTRRDLLAPVKSLSTRLQSPALRDFAVKDEGKRRLERMERRITEILHVANALEQTQRPYAEGANGALRSLGAIRTSYIESFDEAGPEEQAFLRAVLARIEAAETSLTVLRDIEAGGDLPGESLATRLDQAVERYREAIGMAEASGHSPLETVPWQRGAQRELGLVQLHAGLLRAYEEAAGAGVSSYPKFQSDVLGFVQAADLPLSEPAELEVTVLQLGEIVSAARGDSGLPRVRDWNWVDAAVEDRRRKAKFGFMGVNEEVASVVRCWRPFWAASVSYSQASGVVLRSGAAAQAFLLLDALDRRQAQISRVPLDAGWGPQIQSALGRPAADSLLTLPALVDRQRAQRMLEASVRGNPQFPNGRVKVEGVLWLPSVVAHYQSKEGARAEEVIPIESYRADIQSIRGATARFRQSVLGS